MREVDDRRRRILFVRNHEYRKVTRFGDCAVLFRERFALGTAQQERRAPARHKHRAALKLRAPAGQIPAVADIELIVIDERKIEVLFFENLPHCGETVFTFTFDQVAHNKSPCFKVLC